MTASLYSQWIMCGDPDKNFSTWHMEFYHGRHRPKSSQQVRLVAGQWCRRGSIARWEPIA